MKPISIDQVRPVSHLFPIQFYHFITLLFLIGFCAACSPTDVEETEEQVAENIHVAFAGGGWRAHTGHAAWVMSLLAANNNASGCTLSEESGNPDCLQAAFTNVKTISGNSGGSWFSSMLMYDADFINEITSDSVLYNWGTTDSTNLNQGWLGKQENYFSNFSSKCGSKQGAAYLECVLEEYFSSTAIPTPSWSAFVQDLVYKGYNWQAYGTLDGGNHQAWAQDKSLLIAGTWLTNTVVLNDEGSFYDELYYQVCKSPKAVDVDGDDGAWCLDQPNGQKVSTPDVLPVTFTSLTKTDTSLLSPTFIGTEPSLYNLGYSGAYATSTTPTKNNTLQSGNNYTGSVPVISASTASSAAAGYAASYTVAYPKVTDNCSPLSAWDCVYHSRDLAIGFKLPDNTNQVDYVPASDLDNLLLDDLNDNRVIRVADGGAIDNSAVAQLVGYLQLNKQDSDFNIVAFDDVQLNDGSNKDKYPSSDISYMFDGAPPAGVCVQGVCVNVPGLAIMELSSSPTAFTKYTWTVVQPDGTPTTDSLHYYIYEVQTVANSDFNIKGGSTGTLHVFASEFSCADTAPENNNDFPCYNAMIENFRPTLERTPNNGTSTKTGLTMLSEAFGLQ